MNHERGPRAASPPHDQARRNRDNPVRRPPGGSTDPGSPAPEVPLLESRQSWPAGGFYLPRRGPRSRFIEVLNRSSLSRSDLIGLCGAPQRPDAVSGDGQHSHPLRQQCRPASVLPAGADHSGESHSDGKCPQWYRPLLTLAHHAPACGTIRCAMAPDEVPCDPQAGASAGSQAVARSCKPGLLEGLPGLSPHPGGGTRSGARWTGTKPASASMRGHPHLTGSIARAS